MVIPLSLKNKDINYEGVRKENVHSLGKYPATMIAPLPYFLLSQLKKSNPELRTLLDPFMGSGTSIIEGQSVGYDVTGFDINPYAFLLTEVKSSIYMKKDLQSSINKVIEKIYNPNFYYEIYDFNNIEKWFRNDIIDSLSKIRFAITQETNDKIRKFFWICMSEVIYRHSNDRTSTFKLHIRKNEDIEKIQNKCFDQFAKLIVDKSKFLSTKTNSNIILEYGDVLKLLPKISSESYDIVFTSPPYGDNNTTVPYGQSTVLYLKWIDNLDLMNHKDVLNTYSGIDSASLGGKYASLEMPNSNIARDYINKLSDAKKKKVIKFLSDYEKILIEFARVLSSGGYIILTVGNRRVDGLEQPLDAISKEILLNEGITEIEVLTRSITGKTIPTKISNVTNKGPVKSMTEEKVLIFRKL